MPKVVDKKENAHSDSIWTVRWKKGNIITGSVDSKVKQWNKKLELIKEYEGHLLGVVSIDVNLEGTMAASSGLDHHINLYNLKENTQTTFVTSEQATMETWCIAFSPITDVLSSSSQFGNINMWSLSTKEKDALPTNGKFAMGLCYSSDGKYLATGSVDGVVSIFDLQQENKKIFSVEAHSMPVRSLAFSPDSKTLLTASDDKHVNIGQSEELVYSFSGHKSWVTSVKFSPNGKVFATASCDRTVKLWDLATKQCTHTFSEHSDQVWDIAFNDEDESELVSVSDDKSIITYSIL